MGHSTAGQLVYDSSSPIVRTAAVNGLSLLVSNPIAQTLLKAMLPKIGRLLWDPAVQVRTAFIDLLIGVQCVTTFPCFYLRSYAHVPQLEAEVSY